jgi:phosphoribosylformimino-5-aminoimidazole carboxamide ribotide isomerase
VLLMSSFTIYPAIDLRRGQVVRLVQGDPSRQTIYADEPGAIARRWIEAGAAWLHVVNLDGAFGDSDRENQAALTAILAEATRLSPPGKVQLGGGLRSLADLERAFILGVDRAILGTAAVEDPSFVEQALRQFGAGRLALAIDVHHRQLRVRGWQAGSRIDPTALGVWFARLGGRTAIYTDVSRDGLGRGVNVSAARKLSEASRLEVIASGGVSSQEDVQRVRQAGLQGIIVGRALYQGQVDLRELLSC